MLPVAILAGGLATRLRPLTESVPKSMVTVGGKPFIEHQLKVLARQGVKKIILCTGFLGNMIEDFVGSGSEFGMEVSYSRETNQLLGTGGALLQALSLLEENFSGFQNLDISVDRLVAALGRDKKNVGRDIVIILLSEPGALFQHRITDDSRLRAICAEYLENLGG